MKLGLLTSLPVFDTDRVAMTSRDLPHEPLLRRTLEATAASSENQVPTRNEKKKLDVILSPAQQKNPAETANLQTSSTARPPKPHPSRSRSTTFWTACYSCMMKYEYLNIFRNKEIMCHECELPFVAIKVPAPDQDAVKAFYASLRDPSDAIE